MSQPLDDYLSRVARELRSLPPSARENELREVRSHLEQLVEDNIAQGQSRDVATQTALATFGDSRAVARELRDVWEGGVFSWKQLWRALFCGFVFYMTALFVSIEVCLLFTELNFPPIPPWLQTSSFISFVAGVPFATGLIFTFYMKRKSWIPNLILWSLFAFASFLLSASVSDDLTSWDTFSFQIVWLIFTIGLGYLGTLAGNAIARRRRNAKWALQESKQVSGGENAPATG